MICLNRMHPSNIQGYVEGVRQDCLQYIQGVLYTSPTDLATMLTKLPTVMYLREDMRMDVLFGINEGKGNVVIKFREAVRPADLEYMTEEDVAAFLSSETEEFYLRQEWVWLQP